MCRCVLLAVVVIGSIQILALPARAGESAKAIIQKAIKAHGGEKTAKFRAHAWKADGYMLMGEQKQNYKADYTFMSPNYLRFDLEMNFGGQNVKLTAATNGKTAWEQLGEMMREMDKKKSKEFNQTAYVIYISQLTPLLKKGFTLTALEEIKINGKAAVGVNVSKKGQRDVKMFFDKKTHLLAKTETRILDEFSGKEVTQEAYSTGYKKKKGITQFTTLTIKRGGKTFIVEQMSDHRALEKVDTKMFAIPKTSGK